MKVKENKVVDIATLQCRIDQLYAICQSLTADSLAKDEDIARMSRECGELRLKLEKAEIELAKSQTSSKQENARTRSIMAELLKTLEAVSLPQSAQRIAPNESVSSELSRVQTRVAALVTAYQTCSASETEGKLKLRDGRIFELEGVVKQKEAEIAALSNDFSTKLLEMRSRMDIQGSELENLNKPMLRVPAASALP